MKRHLKHNVFNFKGSLVNVCPQKEGAAEIKIPIVKACLVQDGRLKADAVKKDRVAFVSIKPCRSSWTNMFAVYRVNISKNI